MANLLLPWNHVTATTSASFAAVADQRTKIKPMYHGGASATELYVDMLQYIRTLIAYLHHRMRNSVKPLILLVWRRVRLDENRLTGGDVTYYSNTTQPYVDLGYAIYTCINLSIFAIYDTSNSVSPTVLEHDNSARLARVEQLSVECVGLCRLYHKIYAYCARIDETDSLNRQAPPDMVLALEAFALMFHGLCVATRIDERDNRLRLAQLCRVVRIMTIGSRAIQRVHATHPPQFLESIQPFRHVLAMERLRLLSSVALVIADNEVIRAEQEFKVEAAVNYFTVRRPKYETVSAVMTVHAGLFYTRAISREITWLEKTQYGPYIDRLSERNEADFQRFYTRLATAQVSHRRVDNMQSTERDQIQGMLRIQKALRETVLTPLLKQPELHEKASAFANTLWPRDWRSTTTVHF